MAFKKCEGCSVLLSTAVEFVICSGGCKKYFCTKCMKISRTDYRALCDSESLIWSCEICKDILPKIFKYLEDIKNELCNQKHLVESHEKTLKEIVDICKTNKLSEEVADEIKKVIRAENVGKTNSYADVLKVNDPVVVIVPKDVEQKSSVTKKLIKDKIDPADNNVSGIRSGANGSVVVECKSKAATEQFKEQAVSKLGDQYLIKLPEQRKPKLKIINIHEKLSDEVIVANIKKQNEFINPEADIKVVKINETKRGRYTDYAIIIETDSKTFADIVSREKLSIGWDKCKVFEHIQVYRCYKCLGFNHQAKDCKSTKKCKWCSEEHKEEDCKSDVQKCVNCVWANKNLKLDLDVNHHAYSKDCEVLANKIDRERKKINFSE